MPRRPGYDAGMTDPNPGERRLSHPPSDRYRAAEAQAELDAADPAASIARGVAVATAVAIVGSVAIVLLGGALTLTEGLIVVAGFTGLGIGIALRWGEADQLSRERRVVLALVLAIGATAIGQLGLWQYALTEGGVLPLLDFLEQVYGPVVLLEFAAAAVVAWLAAR
jgi:hypothetical protein